MTWWVHASGTKFHVRIYGPCTKRRLVCSTYYYELLVLTVVPCRSINSCAFKSFFLISITHWMHAAHVNRHIFDILMKKLWQKMTCTVHLVQIACIKTVAHTHGKQQHLMREVISKPNVFVSIRICTIYYSALLERVVFSLLNLYILKWRHWYFP